MRRWGKRVNARAHVWGVSTEGFHRSVRRTINGGRSDPDTTRPSGDLTAFCLSTHPALSSPFSPPFSSASSPAPSLPFALNPSLHSKRFAETPAQGPSEEGWTESGENCNDYASEEPIIDWEIGKGFVMTAAACHTSTT